MLGKTIGEIAWQKGGIFKVSLLVTQRRTLYKQCTQEGVPAITVNQPQEGMNVLRQRSVDLKV